MIDILFLAHKRPEFTRASLEALLKNTPGAKISIYVDGDAGLFLDEELKPLLKANFERQPEIMIDVFRRGGPVASMNAFLKASNAKYAREGTPPEAIPEFIAKIDNDVIVPPGWLEECIAVMSKNPEIDLLGIEPWTPDERLFPQWYNPMACATFFNNYRSVHLTSHIGGIGLFRRSVFERCGLPTPNSKDGRYGFTEWQWANQSIATAFIDPPLPVFLLDHLPFEPWRTLSAKYEAEGIQRAHGWEYDPVKHRALWDWWVTSGEGLGAEKSGVGGPER